MSDNKLVKTILEAATLTGIVAGIGWVAKKVAKENFKPDPSCDFMKNMNPKQLVDFLLPNKTSSGN